jgi:hypothetical protein
MKNPALRVEVNGTLVAIAGASDLSMLTGTVGLGSGKDVGLNTSNILFSVMGLAVHGEQPRQLTWCKNITLQAGDKVTFQVVDAEQLTPPDQTLRTPSSAELAAEAAKNRNRTGRQSK